MDVDEDDDFYAPEEAETISDERAAAPNPSENEPTIEQTEEELEEGEEEDEEVDDDSDIDIITERKDGTKAAPPSPRQARYNEIRNIPQRTGSSDALAKAAPIKKESNARGASTSGADLPPVSTSKIDINAKPMYEPAGKLLTQVNIDEDLAESEKPWRRPGTDISDYFNYGFDEFTWALYAAKQDSIRAEYPADTQKKMMDEMNMMMMGQMPGMPGGGGAQAGMTMPGMPGMDGMPPEMQQMMQQMMGSGMDPGQMDPAAMFAAMAGGAGATGGGAGQGSQQNFGNQQGFAQGQGYGYDQGMGGMGNNRGNFRGRGRGRQW